jgi:DNA-binding Lrp family transcriptional regulator
MDGCRQEIKTHSGRTQERVEKIKNQEKNKISLSNLQLDIIYKISEHKEVNLERISKELGISKSTIHYNYKKLEEMGLIQGFVPLINEGLLGLDITAITFVRTKYVGGSGKELGDELAKIPGVVAVYYVLGDIDFIVISKALNREDLKRIIDAMSKIDGVERTSTQYVLTTIKEEKDLFSCYPSEIARILFANKYR